MRTRKLAYAALLIATQTFFAAALVQAAPITGGTGPGGVEFTNGSSNLQLWLRSDFGVSQADAAGRISAWADMSGHVGRNGTQANTTLQPALVSSVAAANNLPAIRFSNEPADDGRRLSITNFTAGFTAGEAFAVFLVDNDPASSATVAGSPYKYGNGQQPHLPYSDGNLYDDFASSARKTMGPTNGTALDLSTAYRNYNVVSTSTQWTARIDGNTHFTTGTNTVAFNGAALEIGYGAGREWEAEMTEHIMFNRALNGVERQIIENYIASRYNLTTLNDVYSGDSNAKGDYDFGVFGIGNNGTSSVTMSGSEGLGIEATGGSLGSTEFVLAGHQAGTNSLTGAGVSSQRWDRVWYIETNNNDVDVELGFGWSDSGLLDPFDADFDTLYFSLNDPYSFSPIASASSTSGDQVFFNLLASEFQSGYYTLGFAPIPAPEPSSILLLGLGLVMGARSRKRSKATLS